MSLRNIIKDISEQLEGSASVETVYGQPIVAEGKAVAAEQRAFLLG